VICSSCGAENRPGRRFCAQCAAPLAVICPNCGSANDPGDRFCGECATPLPGDGGQRAAVANVPVDAEAAGSATAATRAERRLVSVLFADLVGFTPFAEERDAEDVRDTLTSYFELASDVIGRYGGVVEKFIGDAVMAVWGTPTAREDDAERAVRAGLELVDGVGRLGPEIQARVGIVTGEAAVTLGARNQGMVAGDIVNTAARLQSVAPPGSVLVGEATHRAASLAIAFEEAGPQVLKGKSSPVPAWRAQRVVAEIGGRNRSDALEAPFVGRNEELRLLKDLFHATGRERRARLVSVIGPAGIGKTRLAWEFLKYIDGLVEQVLWHDGRSPAYGDGITFWALGEMVRTRARLLETDDEATSREKIAATVAEYIADEDERRWVERALLALLGLESGVDAGTLYGAWRTFFERLAARSPVVMVFEDFHHADPGLIEFVDQLAERSRNAPIYVLTLSRPELLDTHGDWGAGKRSFTSLHLEPLSDADMRDLLAGLVPGLPPAVASAVVGRADGIPLYAVEIVRMLLADGRLAADGDVYVPRGDLSQLAVPETLTALIAARLDALDPDDRSLVQDAAVLGQSFTVAALASMTGIAEAALDERIRPLVRRELLRLESDPRSPERGQYTFVQALIREVAYGTLGRVDRKTRHLAAARYFEGLGSEELAGALAGHYLAAHRNAPAGAEAEALASQARIALRAAASRAESLGAFAQAVTFHEQELEVTTDPADRAAIEVAAAYAAESAADPDRAEAYLRRALDFHRDRGDADAGARVAVSLARVYSSSGRVENAMAIMREALSAGRAAISPGAAADLHAQLARALMLHNERDASIEEADLALAVASDLDLVPIIADVLVTKGTDLIDSVRVREGVAIMYGALELARSKGLPPIEFRATNNLAVGLLADDPLGAHRVALGGLVRAHALGYREWELQFARLDTVLQVDLGGWDELLETLARLEQEPVPNEVTVSIAQIRARVLALRGDRAGAVEMIARSAAGLATLSNPTFRSHHLISESIRAFVDRDFEACYEAGLEAGTISLEMAYAGGEAAARAAVWMKDPARLETARSTFRSVGARGALVDATEGTWELATTLLRGDGTDAGQAIRSVLGLWQALGLTYATAQFTLDMASLVGDSEDLLREAIAEARSTFVRLQATPLIEMLDEATGRQEVAAMQPVEPAATRSAVDVVN
jgi:class 3 adenylate cyclase/tetratricopeptide (TPR) repeat protein